MKEKVIQSMIDTQALLTGIVAVILAGLAIRTFWFFTPEEFKAVSAPALM